MQFFKAIFFDQSSYETSKLKQTIDDLGFLQDFTLIG